VLVFKADAIDQEFRKGSARILNAVCTTNFGNRTPSASHYRAADDIAVEEGFVGVRVFAGDGSWRCPALRSRIPQSMLLSS
jgi:hypothetical protein